MSDFALFLSEKETRSKEKKERKLARDKRRVKLTVNQRAAAAYDKRINEALWEGKRRMIDRQQNLHNYDLWYEDNWDKMCVAYDEYVEDIVDHCLVFDDFVWLTYSSIPRVKACYLDNK